MALALVTGGSRGIGRAVCLALAEHGYDVAFCYASDDAAAEQTARLIETRGAGALAFRCDVSDEAAVKQMFSSLPGLRLLVNNAGIALYGEISRTSYAAWQRVMAVNAGGVFLCTRAAEEKFVRAGGGCIVNVSSVWGEAGASCEAAYAASKAAVIGFTKASAKELAPAGIRVNCVSCGFIDTEMNARLTSEERADFLRGVPLGRAASPEEAAAAVLFLADSPYITGEVLRLDGGLL